MFSSHIYLIQHLFVLYNTFQTRFSARKCFYVLYKKSSNEPFECIHVTSAHFSRNPQSTLQAIVDTNTINPCQ